MNDKQKAHISRLLVDWMEAVDRFIWEVSGDTVEQERELVACAKEQCALIGIDWSDDLVPEEIRERLQRDDEERAEEERVRAELREQGIVNPEWDTDA